MRTRVETGPGPQTTTVTRQVPGPTAANGAGEVALSQRMPPAQLPTAVVHQAPAPAYPPKIAKALLAVTRKVQPVEKAGINDFHKYAYPKWEDIRDELWPLLADNGLIIIQNETAHEGLTTDMIAISYDFTILNDDGDVWPVAPKVTAICKIRDNKGMLDDKAASKCRTQAEKNCMVQLFKIRTEDVYEVDQDGKVHKNSPRRRPVPSPDGKIAPHYLQGVEGETARTWTDKFLVFIKKAASTAEIDEWEELNGKLIDLVKSRDASIYNEIVDAMNAREAALGGGKPDPISSGKPDAGFPGDRKPAAREVAEATGTEIPVDLDRKLTDSERDWLISLRDAYNGCATIEEIAAEQDSIMMPSQASVSPHAWRRASDLTDQAIERVQGGK